jgi:hypothetical protein
LTAALEALAAATSAAALTATLEALAAAAATAAAAAGAALAALALGPSHQGCSQQRPLAAATSATAATAALASPLSAAATAALASPLSASTLSTTRTANPAHGPDPGKSTCHCGAPFVVCRGDQSTQQSSLRRQAGITESSSPKR